METKEYKPRRERTLFGSVLTFELCIAIALFVLFMAPRFWGVAPEVVWSASMEPSVPAGSVAYVDTKVNAEELRTGDIAVREAGPKLVMHRVVSVSEEGFQFKGDANPDPDEGLIGAAQIRGKYTGMDIPLAGYAYDFFDKHRIECMLALLAANAAIYAVSAYVWRRKDRKDEERKGDDADGASDMPHGTSEICAA